jgi:iron complex transport system substrate-binding protein
MRIVSLLPSLTELVCMFGRRGDLVGVTHECDYPPGVERLPHLTRSAIPTSASSREIDELVAQQAGSLYHLEVDRLAALKPDLILTQSQCDVCAVNEATVRQVAASLPGSPHVESVNPIDLAGVTSVIQRIGDLLGASHGAAEWWERFQNTVAEIETLRAGRKPAGVVLLEWFDPPFIAGHWNPEVLALAGGNELLGKSGQPSRRVSWDDVILARPEVVLVSPCGFTLDRSDEELNGSGVASQMLKRLSNQGARLALIDGSAYFSRPGPRLETSLRIAAAAIDPELCGELGRGGGWRVLEAFSV